jgi:cell wall-associated NlpC family hydrolase
VIAILEDADKNGWVKVALCDGREGYIKNKFLGEYITSWSLEDEAKLRVDVVNTALMYMGTQYRWGGKSSLGIDCSGLCSAAYMLNGVIIYRDAKIMEGYPVHEIAFEYKKPGDMLFFPGHVAMCIGKDKYVHSTGKNGSDGVVINSLNPKDAEYREDLLKSLKAVGSIF